MRLDLESQVLWPKLRRRYTPELPTIDKTNIKLSSFGQCQQRKSALGSILGSVFEVYGAIAI